MSLINPSPSASVRPFRAARCGASRRGEGRGQRGRGGTRTQRRVAAPAAVADGGHAQARCCRRGARGVGRLEHLLGSSR